jgi:hypothetical protein
LTTLEEILDAISMEAREGARPIDCVVHSARRVAEVHRLRRFVAVSRIPLGEFGVT